MTAMGKTRALRATISEPEPGRVLVETYQESQTVTTSTVVPHGDGKQLQVTFTTEFPMRSGLLGIVQRAFAT